MKLNAAATYIIFSGVSQPASEGVHLCAEPVILQLHLPELVGHKRLLHHHVILGALELRYLVLELLPGVAIGWWLKCLQRKRNLVDPCCTEPS